MSDKDSLGPRGEEIAADHLAGKGYRILHRNWKSGRHEIDLVAEINNTVVFVEVKTRSGDYDMLPRDLVSPKKQKIIILAAENYIRKYNINKNSRFDIIIIISKDKTNRIEHIEEAYYPTLR